MGPVSVVVAGVLVQEVAQVSLAKDQHPVGELGPGGEHEPFGVAVGPSRRLHPMSWVNESFG